jgi:putative ABC transport system permease protein
LRGLLVISELTLSLMLLIGAGLLVRSFVRLQSVPPGFSTAGVLAMQIAANDPKYRDEKARVNLYRDLEQRVSRLPGIKSEGVVSALPLTGAVGWGGIQVEGYTPLPGRELQVDIRTASTDYFRTMGIPLIKGRFFSEYDTTEMPPVVIIDEKFAQRFWPNDNPIGKHLWFDPKKPITIVGVVGVVKQYGLETDDKIATYFSQQQNPNSGMFLVVRGSSDATPLAAAITREVHAVDPTAVVYGIRSMQDRLYDSLARQRFASTMLGAFALFALLLASVGLYGVMSYLVSQSTRDIGVRMALGARPGDILGMVVRQGMELSAVGIVAGLVGALAVTRVMASLLFGVSAMDAATFAMVPAILATVALAATAIPALRATRVDPVVALREE